MRAMFGDPASRDDRRLAGLKKGRVNRSRGTTHVMLHGVEHKSCASCASLQPLENYAHDKSHVDGLYSYCKACHARLQRERTARKRSVA